MELLELMKYRRSIRKYEERQVSKDDLYDIAQKTCSTFLLHRVNKYDRSFRKENTARPKYYCVDNGLRQSVLLPGRNDDGILLENAVCIQLMRNLADGEKLCYFMGNRECDFVVQNDTDVRHLVQVCWDMNDVKTRERELAGITEAAAETGFSLIYPYHG